MTTFLQWSSIVAAGALLAAYGFYRDRRDLRKEEQQKMDAERRAPQQVLFEHAGREHDSAWTRTS